MNMMMMNDNMTRGLLQTEAICKGKIRNIAEYLNTKYKED
jgi:hypothetical protein